MNDERVVLGTPLGLEDMIYGCLIQSIGAQSVHRFRGNAQKAPFPDDPGAPGQNVSLIFLIGVKYNGLQNGSSFFF